MRCALLIFARTHSRIHFRDTQSLVLARRFLHDNLATNDEGRHYNFKFLAKVVDALDKNALAGVRIDYYIHIVRLCGHLKALVYGRRVHEHLIGLGIAENPHLATHVIQMYLKCGSVAEAFKSCEGMPLHDLILWTTMTTAYAQHKRWQDVLRLFDLMELYNLRPARVTYFAVLKAYNSPECLSGARLMHKHLIDARVDTREHVKAALIEMYSKCGSFEDARHIFYTAQQNNVFATSAMVAACVQHGYYRMASELFRAMESRYTSLGKTTLVAMLDACTRAEDLELGKHLHDTVLREGYVSDLLVAKALVGMYGRCGDPNDALKIFAARGDRDADICSLMISAYASHGRCREGFLLLQEMQADGLVEDSASLVAFLAACASLLALEEGRAAHGWILRMDLARDDAVVSALVDMYCNCGSLAEAEAVFGDSGKAIYTAWNTMLAGYTRAGQSTGATRLFSQMQLEGFNPDTATFTSLLLAFGHAGLVQDGLGYFTSMKCDFGVQPTRQHYACVVSILGQQDWLQEAEDFVHRLPEFEPGIWQAFLDGSRAHCDTDRATDAAVELLQLGFRTPGPYIVLSGIYDAKDQPQLAAEIRDLMVSRDVIQERVASSILINGAVYHEFGTGDRTHRSIDKIHAQLEELQLLHVHKRKKLDLHEVGEELADGCIHSELLAIGIGLLKTPSGTPLRIVKNARVCADCHSALETVSRIASRLLVVRAGGHFHMFNRGACSCNGYW